MLLFNTFASPFTHSSLPQHREIIPERVDGCSISYEHLSPSTMYIDPQVFALLSCQNYLFTSPENLSISFSQPPFSSISNGNLPTEDSKHAYCSSEHSEVFSFLSLITLMLSVLCLENTMKIVQWIKVRRYFFPLSCSNTSMLHRNCEL